jgi:sec-independent protein translocase protein TatA
MNFSPLELIVIAILVILLFGVKRLPELGSGLGQAINNFKKSFKETQNLDSKSNTNIENKDNNS